MALANVENVAARLGREISGAEAELAATLLDDAELIVRRRVPDLDARAANDSTFRDTVVMVEATMVARVLRNPGGYRSESEGDYSYSVDTRAAAGFLTVLPDEWALLGVSGGAFSIAPSMPRGASSGVGWWTEPPWAFQYSTPGEPGSPWWWQP